MALPAARAAEGGPAFLGISSHGLTGEEARRLALSTRDGALVDEVYPGTAAEAAGLKEDDLIVEFAGEKVLDDSDLTELIRSHHPSDKAAIVVLRGKERKTLNATLGRPEDFEDREQPSWTRVIEHLFGDEGDRPKLGVNVMELNSQLATYFGVADGEGVLITRVTTNSPAERGGLLAGDVVTKVEGHRVSDTGDIGSALPDKAGATASVEIVRKGSRKEIKIDLD
jgi:serine protease Do